MTKPLPLVLYVVLMIAVIVGADLLFFRDCYQARLIGNIAIVAVFAVGYPVFFRKA